MLEIVKGIKSTEQEQEDKVFWKSYNEWIDYSNSDEYFEELRYKKAKERKEINISNVKELPF